jgi:hypothetical protein
MGFMAHRVGMRTYNAARGDESSLNRNAALWAKLTRSIRCVVQFNPTWKSAFFPSAKRLFTAVNNPFHNYRVRDK